MDQLIHRQVASPSIGQSEATWPFRDLVRTARLVLVPVIRLETSPSSDIASEHSMTLAVKIRQRVEAAAIIRKPRGRARYASRPWPRLAHDSDRFCGVS